MKAEIKPLESSIDRLMQLRPSSYKYDVKLDKYVEGINMNEYDEIKQKTIQSDIVINYQSEKMLGFVAEELQEIYPELVHVDEDGYAAINYDGLIPVLVKAIQEQQNRIDELENELRESRNEKSNRNKVEEGINLDKDARLYNNIPNPTSDKTSIPFFISEKSKGSKNQILIYNQKGNLVKKVDISNQVGNSTIKGFLIKKFETKKARKEFLSLSIKINQNSKLAL